MQGVGDCWLVGASEGGVSGGEEWGETECETGGFGMQVMEGS